MNFDLNPHLAFVRVVRRAPSFAMPPSEGIVPGLCRTLERAVRNPYSWGKRKPHAYARTQMRLDSQPEAKTPDHPIFQRGD